MMNHRAIYLADLLAHHFEPVEGSVHGLCVVCRRETDCGTLFKEHVSSNFVSYNLIFSGDCICPTCSVLFADQTLRRKSWVASPVEFRMLTKDEFCAVLFNPPEPPFFIHIATSGQKPTWLSCLYKVASSREHYWFSHESYDVPVWFDRSRAEVYVGEIDAALEVGIGKGELSTCQFSMKTWRKALSDSGKEVRTGEKLYDFLRRISAQRRGNILWEVLVDVRRKNAE